MLLGNRGFLVVFKEYTYMYYGSNKSAVADMVLYIIFFNILPLKYINVTANVL